MAENRTGLEIAVIGMAGRFPGAKDIAEFWDNLSSGTESISFFTDEELLASGVDPEVLKDPNYVKARGILAGIEDFDPEFFEYTPREAELMDPQLRLLHECTWQALEDAGYDPENYHGLIGFYAGGEVNLGWMAGLANRQADLAEMLEIGNLNTGYSLSTRISYKFNLKGPSFVVQTACSTSLVAIHLAIQGLLSGECDIALAGGVAIKLPAKVGYLYQDGMVLSPDGHCRAFDSAAKGTNGGDGVGIVALKRLEDALQDGDHIYAVVKGSAINNDGLRKVGYTAPSTKGQTEVIKAAHQMAEVEPESISYIEAHGTGTTLGDPIEIEALKLAFNSEKRHFCRIGSVKTNVGHLDAAAGVASFIKTVLALHHKQIPASLNYSAPSPRIDFQNSPFVVNTELMPWQGSPLPLRAGVSAFGIGGTNAHVVLEEAPAVEELPRERQYELLLLSAKNPTALEQAAANLGKYLEQHPQVNLTDLAYTLQKGRQALKHRLMLTIASREEAVESLKNTKWMASIANEGTRPLIFMFPGQGAQYVKMGLDLYETEPVFREEMDRCFTLLKPMLGFDLKAVIYPEANSTLDAPKLSAQIASQPAFFVFEYALAKLLLHWGLKPYAMIGYSIGEYVAACLAGVFGLLDALKLVVLRGKLMHSLPTGVMLNVPLREEELKPLLPSDVSLAVVNGPSCIVAGSNEAITAFERKMKEQRCICMRLNISHAGHSEMLTDMLQDFENEVRQVKLSKPTIPYISNITGKWISVEEATDPAYWARHLRDTVRFADGVKELLKRENALFVEVGPGHTLSVLVKHQLKERPDERIFNLIRHAEIQVSDVKYLLDRIGRLWLYGCKVDWDAFYQEKRRRLALPTYPFIRQRYWPDTASGQARFKFASSGVENPAEMGPLKKKTELTEWFYQPVWKSAASPVYTQPGDETWLVLTNECEFNTLLLDQINKAGLNILTVQMGAEFTKLTDTRYQINPQQKEDYERLAQTLQGLAKPLTKIVHLLGVTEEKTPTTADLLDTGFYSLLYLAQALGKYGLTNGVKINVLTNNMQEVTGGETLIPEKATVLGPCKVISQELLDISCQSIDIVLPVRGSQQEQRLLTALMNEFAAQANENEQVVAYRGSQRWVQDIAGVSLAKTVKAPKLRQKGVYLITGGLGGVGLVFGEYLARTYQARLILTGRSAFPAQAEWDEWLKTHDSTDRISQKIQKLRTLESLGSEILVFSADVADYQCMQEVLTTAAAKFGPLNGVIHCAGNPGGGMLQLKNQADSRSVLDPKIQGTLVLDRLLAEAELDFLVLCSSLNAILPAIGQVDYCAANAFLDAFARQKTAATNRFTVSINWDAWQEVGRTAEMVRALSGKTAQVLTHPLLNRRQETQRGVCYFSRLSTRHWVLDEHRILGKATLPGTGMLEMIRAAFADYVGEGPKLISEVFFLSPCTVEDGKEKEVRIYFTKSDEEYEFYLVGPVNGSDNRWIEHAWGKIKQAQAAAQERRDVQELAALCTEKTLNMEDQDTLSKAAAEQGLKFGPRWFSLNELKIGQNTGLALLELPSLYASDLSQYQLHPALFDVATSSTGTAVRKEGNYLPISYKNLRINQSLTRKVISHSEHLPTANNENIRFKVTVLDEAGNELVTVEEYTIRNVTLTNTTSAGTSGKTLSEIIGENSQLFQQENLLEKDLQENGILPAEGVEVFLHILTAGLPQVVVSTQDLPKRIQHSRFMQKSFLLQGLADNETSQVLRKRPELSSTFVPPKTATEQKLAAIWQQYLKIDGIGAADDFFELGGNSLNAITVVSKIHKELNVEIPLAEIFNTPTIAGLARYIEEQGTVSQYTAIKPAEKKPYYELSAAQKRLYILQQMNRENMNYNLPFTVILEGQLDRAKLKATFMKMIERHESLRTSFLLHEGMAMQQIHDVVDFAVEYYEADENDLQNFLKGLQKPFDLSKAPIIRAAVVKIAEEKHVLLVDMHHIISDGISLGIFIQEYMALYAGQELPPLKVQYKDYSELQHAEKERFKAEEDYWLKTFAGEIPVLNLPMDYARPAVKSFEGKYQLFTLENEETKALKRLALNEDATIYMVLTALFNVLLAKLSGQEDIIIGTPVAGRKHIDLQNVIGMFVNTLALRNYPAPVKTFREFLQEVKQGTLQAFAHQDYQFEDLVEKVAVSRDMSRNPIFDVMFSMQNSDILIREIGAPGLVMKPFPYEKGVTKFDITLLGVEEDERLAFFMEYSTALFSDATIQRFINYFQKIIAVVLQDVNIKLAEIEVISSAEKTQILEEFNASAIAYPTDKTVCALFNEHVANNPEVIAAAFGGETLTYCELNQRANGLARLLRSKGVGRETIVGLMVERSLDMAVGIMAILKAGGAYLPIDPNYPLSGKEFIISDSGIHILLSQKRLQAEFPGVEVIAIDELEFSPEETADVEVINQPEDLVYIIYTSGTTGRPKGVMLEHRNLVNLVFGLNDRIYKQYGKSLRVCVVSPYVFDASVKQIFAALLLGHSLYIVPEEARLNGAQLLEFYRTYGIEVSDGTPGHLRLLLDVLKDEQPIDLSVKNFVIGGEALQKKLAESFFRCFQTPPVITDVYGPTECCVDSTAYVVTEENLNKYEAVPIGGPMPNVQVYIMDGGNQLLPVGVAGELCVSGAGVSRGYLNRPELTQEKFIPNPYTPGTRLYRTGDLARWLPDGQIDYLGRIDQQVKIRGFRIELGAIEHYLLQHPEIKGAAVIDRLDTNGHKYLCAYYTAPHELTVSELRAYLAKELPEYMLPPYFIHLAKLPLTPNGKIDRRALPEPEGARPKLLATYVAPKQGVEKTIADVWQKVLQLDRVGSEDNFFDLGGNSFDIIRINNELKEILQRDIPVVVMFRYPSVSALARFLEAEEAQQTGETERTETLTKAKATMKQALKKMRGDQNG